MMRLTALIIFWFAVTNVVCALFQIYAKWKRGELEKQAEQLEELIKKQKERIDKLREK